MAETPSKRNMNLERPKVASRDELNRFLAKLAKSRQGIKNREGQDYHDAVRAALQQVDRRELQRLFARAFTDVLKSPGQKLGTAKPPKSWMQAAKITGSAKSKKRTGSSKKRSRRKRRNRR